MTKGFSLVDWFNLTSFFTAILLLKDLSHEQAHSSVIVVVVYLMEAPEL